MGLGRGGLSMIPGWTGGDRMRAKTHNVGRAPLPYPGSFEQFQAAVETALVFYHQGPQSGTLRGQSPAQALQGHIAAGWTKTHIEDKALLLAFAEEDTRQVRGGYISWDGTQYYDDALLPLTGQTLTVRVSRHDRRYAFVFDKKSRLICAAGIAPTYAFLDPAGAQEQARRKTVLMRHITALRENCSRLDLVQEMRAVVQAERAAQPSLSTPPPTGASVGITGPAAQMLRALADMEAANTAPQIPTPTDPKRLSQWGAADEIDPLLIDIFTDDVAHPLHPQPQP